MFVIMVTAQASGLDVFGAMARWTKDAFSFRQVPARTEVTDTPGGRGEASGQSQEFSSLQEALDEYGLTQVHEPTRLPDGFVRGKCVVESSDLLRRVAFYADYVNDNGIVTIDIVSHEGTPAVLIQKTDEPPETIEWNGNTFYLVENTSTSVVAWYDDEYEYYVRGMLSKDILWGIAVSMYK